MKHIKLYPLFFIIIILLQSLTACVASPDGTHDSADLVEQFVVNGILYYHTAHPSGEMPETFEYAGEIQKAVEERPTADWTSYTLPAGSQVYLNPEIPHQAWINGEERFCTVDAGRKYIRHDNSLYVHLGSVNSLNGEYYDHYRDTLLYVVDVQEIDYTTTYLGETVFEAYDTFPIQELGINRSGVVYSVYSCEEDDNLLFAVDEDSAWVYVKWQTPVVSDSNE